MGWVLICNTHGPDFSFCNHERVVCTVDVGLQSSCLLAGRENGRPLSEAAFECFWWMWCKANFLASICVLSSDHNAQISVTTTVRLRSKERTGTLSLSLQVMVHKDTLALLAVCRSFLQKDTGWRTLCWAQAHLHWCTSLAQLWVCPWIGGWSHKNKQSHISKHSLIELHTLLLHWLGCAVFCDTGSSDFKWNFKSVRVFFDVFWVTQEDFNPFTFPAQRKNPTCRSWMILHDPTTFAQGCVSCELEWRWCQALFLGRIEYLWLHLFDPFPSATFMQMFEL